MSRPEQVPLPSFARSEGSKLGKEESVSVPEGDQERTKGRGLHEGSKDPGGHFVRRELHEKSSQV